MLRALDLPNAVESYEIRMSITALVKSVTSVPMLRSKAMLVGHYCSRTGQTMMPST